MMARPAAFAVKVTIVRWVSDEQPGMVECELTDRFGAVWHFVEKGPVVSMRSLKATDSYPQQGAIACQVVDRGRDKEDRGTVEVDTHVPWFVAATDGTTRFSVFADQLVELGGR